MEQNNTILKNPKQIVGFNHVNTVFAIQNGLTKAEGVDRNEPLNLHHNHYSRFPVVIINENNQPATANIPIKDMIAIIEKTNFLFSKEMEYACMPKDEDYSSLAYTVRFTSGNMKGKTPAEIIHEDPDWKNKLNKHYEFLKKNLQQYPRNQLQLDAILDASKLQKKGQLVKKERKTISSFQIYESGFRPLIRRQKQTNKGTLSFVYQIWINWNFQMKAPVCIEIENFWAPVIQNKQGLLNVQAEQKEDTIKSSFNLSIDEWLWAMHEVKSNISIFEQKYGSPAYDEAEAAEERKRNSIAK